MGKRVVWAGRYAVFDELASGGMASVYLACRIGAGDSPRVVAIKKMFESFAKRPEFVTMFLDEAHIAARIRHPNVVTTYEFLRIPDSLAIVMDFVLGISLVDLSRIAEEKGIIAPLGVTVAVVADALRGLHAAHEAENDRGEPFGLVHRDVSPHNILVGKDGVARVIDFGIAKAAGRLQVTEVGVMKGKFAYMSPEQIRAEPVDRRADIYSTGVVLWESLTGHPLFRDAANSAVFAKRGAGTVTPPAPSTINPELPSSLDAVVVQALAFEPEKRFATAAQLADALTAVMRPATREQVASWVLSLAESRLGELEKKRDDVERAFAAGDLAGATLDGDSGRGSSPSLDPPAPLMLDVPDLLPAPPKSSPKVVPSTRNVAPTAPSSPPSVRRAAATPPPASSAFDDDMGGAGMPDIKLDYVPPPSGHLVSPGRSLDARAQSPASRAPSSRRERRSGGLGWLVLLIFVACTVGAAYRLGPSFVQSTVASSAARRGVVLTASSSEPRSDGVTLSGVTLSLASVEGVSMKAAEINLSLDWQGNVRAVTIPGYELTVHGTLSEVAARFAAWRAAPHLPLAFEAKAGHLVWSDALSPGVALEGLDVTIVSGAHGEGSLTMDAPSLSVMLPRATVGPWNAHLDSTPDEAKLTVHFDRSKDDGPPNLSLVARPALGTVVNVDLPRSKVVRLGIPVELVRTGSDPEVALSIEAQVMPTGEPVNAHGSLGLFNVATGGAGAPSVDLVFDGAFGGDTHKLLRIDPCTLSVGKVKTKITGTVAFDPADIHFEVDRPSTRSGPVAPFVFDTREWTSAAATQPPPPPPASSASAAPAGKPRR